MFKIIAFRKNPDILYLDPDPYLFSESFFMAEHMTNNPRVEENNERHWNDVAHCEHRQDEELCFFRRR